MPVVIEPWRHEYRDFAMTLGQAKPIYCDTMAIEIETVIFAVLARPKLRLTRDIARKQGVAFLTRIAIDSRSYRMLQNFLIFYSFSMFSFILFTIKEDSSITFVFAYLIVHICKNILCQFHQRILKIEGVINVINSSNTIINIHTFQYFLSYVYTVIIYIHLMEIFTPDGRCLLLTN